MLRQKYQYVGGVGGGYNVKITMMLRTNLNCKCLYKEWVFFLCFSFIIFDLIEYLGRVWFFLIFLGGGATFERYFFLSASCALLSVLTVYHVSWFCRPKFQKSNLSFLLRCCFFSVPFVAPTVSMTFFFPAPPVLL